MAQKISRKIGEGKQKKVLSLVLCVAMMLSVMVVGAGAAFSDQSKIKNTEAVDMCTALNIIGGYPDGTFKPEGNITRAEVTKMICVALNGGKEPAVSTNSTPTFNDVRTNPNTAWAEGFIESCAAQGIVSGVGAGKFNPAGNVTGVQLAKMLLVALGYKSDIENFTGNAWATNVNVRAAQKGLYEGLEKMDTNAAITRDNAAQMVWNALKAKEVEYDYTLVSENGQLVSKTTLKDKNKTLMADKYSANDEHEGTLVGFTYNDTKGEWTYYIQESKTGDPVQYKSSKDFTSLYAQYVSVVYKEKVNSTAVDSVYGIYADADDCQVLATGIVGDFSDVENNKDSVKISGASYDVNTTTNAVPVYYFTYGQNNFGTSDNPELKYALKSQGNLYDLAKKDAKTLDAFKFVAIDKDSDNDIDSIVVYPYAVGQVNTLNSSKISLKSLTDSAAADISKSTATMNLDDVDTYTGIAKDDYVVYTPDTYSATGKAQIAKVDAVVDGKVVSTSGSNITVDSTVYKNLSNKNDSDFSAGGKITDGVIVNGYILLVDSTGAVSSEDYVVVTNADVDGYGATAKLMFSDGTKKVVDLDVVYSATYGDADAQGKKERTLEKVTLDANGVKSIVGKLYTYEKNSDDEYTLTPAIDEAAAKNINDSGFDGVYKGTITKAKDLNSSNKVKYLNGMTISDDAVIYLHHGDSYKVISGAQLKTTDGSNITNVIAYYNKDNSKGSNVVQVAYVTMSSKVQSADSTYGYVLADAASTRNNDNEKCYEIKVWTKDGEKTYLTDGSNSKFNVAEGTVIKYTVNSDGEIDDIALSVATDSSATTGIKEEKDGAKVIGYYGLVPIVSKDGDDLQFVANGSRYSIEKDTVILYVDNGEVKGYTDGSITLASEKAEGGYYANAVFYCDSATDGEIDLLVIDINNDMQDVM